MCTHTDNSSFPLISNYKRHPVTRNVLANSRARVIIRVGYTCFHYKDFFRFAFLIQPGFEFFLETITRQFPFIHSIKRHATILLNFDQNIVYRHRLSFRSLRFESFIFEKNKKKEKKKRGIMYLRRRYIN